MKFTPTVYMMLGLPCSGKTTFSKNLQSELNIIRFSIDEEYSKLGGNLHSSQWDKELASRAGNNIRQQLAGQIARNQSVILDLCPWIKEKRYEYREYIESLGATCCIYYFDIEKEELLRRLAIRNNSSKDYHIVSPKILDDYIKEFDVPLNEKVKLVE